MPRIAAVVPAVVEVPAADSVAAETAEMKLLRVIQRTITAYSQEELPTPAARKRLQDEARAALDAYFVNKLADRSGR